jgi:hypothetical protein
MPHPVLLLLLASFLLLCALCWPYPGPAQSRTAAKIRTTVQRLLKPRTPDDCLACRLATTASSGEGPVPADVASLARGEKPAGSSQAQRHPGLRLSQPKLPLLWHHRCTPTCAGGRWHAWPSRAHPNLSRSCLLYHVHFQAPHPLVPAENPFPPDRRRVSCAGRRAGYFRRRTGLRVAAGHQHHLADSCWRTRTDLTRAFLPQPAPPASAVGRITNQAAQCHTDPLALAGHRSLHQAYTRASTRPPHATHGPCPHPRTPREPGPCLPPALYE